MFLFSHFSSRMTWCSCQAVEESLHHVVGCDWGVWPWRLCWLLIGKMELEYETFFLSPWRGNSSKRTPFISVCVLYSSISGRMYNVTRLRWIKNGQTILQQWCQSLVGVALHSKKGSASLNYFERIESASALIYPFLDNTYIRIWFIVWAVFDIYRKSLVDCAGET